MYLAPKAVNCFSNLYKICRQKFKFGFYILILISHNSIYSYLSLLSQLLNYSLSIFYILLNIDHFGQSICYHLSFSLKVLLL